MVSHGQESRLAWRTPCSGSTGGRGRRNYFAPLERLAKERTVVLYDQIGCGSADRPQDIDWSVADFCDELPAVRDQLGLDRIHLLGTSWGGMLALEHVLSGAEGIVSLVLSSTLASVDEWAAEQRLLRNALPPPGVVEVLDRQESAGTYHDPEYERAMEALFDRHFYRGPKPRAELERMAAESTGVYRAMQGPNEWT